MKKVVIIGGGFAGSYAAEYLEKDKDIDVTLIDTKPYFEFTPGILRTIVEPGHAQKIQVLHRDYLKRAEIIVGEVNEVGKNFVRVKGKKIRFDYLIIASGSRYDLPIKEQNVIIATRLSRLKSYYEKLCRAKRVLIIGGGIVGVELSAEIATHYKDKEITIVHSGERLMPRNDIKTSSYAENFLGKRGVKIIFNDRVEKVSGKRCVTKNGLKLGADLVFICTGIKLNYEFMKKNFSSKIDSDGNLRVNKYLQLEGQNNIFVAGDVAGIKEEKTAQNAEFHAGRVICNIKCLNKKKRIKEYKSMKRIMVISLGKWDGIIEYGSFVFTGLFPGILKTLVEKREMWRRGKWF